MGERFLECHKIHNHLNGKKDGCHGFWKVEMPNDPSKFICDGCGCHQSFHRKVKEVYTKCHRLHVFGSHLSVDGCQKFTPIAQGSAVCICGCDKCFHRNEITVVDALNSFFTLRLTPDPPTYL